MDTQGSASPSLPMLEYDLVALPMTIYYNRDGDHDHNGLLYALRANEPILRYIDALGGHGGQPQDHYVAAEARADVIGVRLPLTPAQARQPHPLVRPLVLRARCGDRVKVTLHNQIDERYVGIHLVAGGYDVQQHDGSDVGGNAGSLAAPGGTKDYLWSCDDEGVFPFHDGGNHSGDEDGTNVHGLFGALVVEPKGSTWRDPITGRGSHGASGTGTFEQVDGLYLDVLPQGAQPDDVPASDTTLTDHEWPHPKDDVNLDETPHREFVIFFHDEPEFLPAHGSLEPDPCEAHHHDGGCAHHGHGKCAHHSHERCGHHRRHGHGKGGNGHGGAGHDGLLPIMPVSYRAEPMINRERRLWRLIRTGHVLDEPVLNEEQHHSSWLFGDPVTPVLRAYIGDPVRIRFVHAAVKETHVFHLHLYEWHAVAGEPTSPRIDAISVSPQTGHTIEPVWGAGNRQQVAGDAIWHCHLYPHFHEGMWGIFRTFETRQDGADGPMLDSNDPVYAGRRIGRYPDGTSIERLLPLPGRAAPPNPTSEHPGFPLYIPGRVRQKSPRPPWPDREFFDDEHENDGYRPPCDVTSLRGEDMPPEFDYRPVPADLERNAFNQRPVPGELFTRNPMARQQTQAYEDDGDLARNSSRQVCHDVVVAQRRIDYNSHGWHDRHGHLYYLASDGDPADAHGPMAPLFFRAQHGQIANLTLRNDLPETVEETEFDLAFPPCPQRPWQGECGLHVHMVKFDPICGDGASVGWNYISGPRFGRKMVYRWWADREFGTIFFHDHLFANYRQKHGLFGALLVEPIGSRFFHHIVPDRQIVSGVHALIQRHPDDPTIPDWFREFCIGIGDFISMWNRRGEALNPPERPGGHGDQGVMGLNYRNAPLRERSGDPAHWFSSKVHGDPDTTIFATYADDPLWIRLVQGSHEESHSFQVHGLRWQRFRDTVDSVIRNQQTTGIAEAFTFVNRAPVRPGDYLYKLAGIDDIWLGCWGLIRALTRPGEDDQESGLLSFGAAAVPPIPATGTRTFRIAAVPRRLYYRDDDIVDPFGLVYRHIDTPGEVTCDQVLDEVADEADAGTPVEPLVLWCREGEEVQVEVLNCLPPGMQPEPFAPEVPVERDPRPVSQRVSLHADLVDYDIRLHDGTNSGFNPPQTIPPGGRRTYVWNTGRPQGSKPEEPLGPVLLQDMADVRNHRHHGLIGALVVLPADATPFEVTAGQPTASSGAAEIWHGARVTVKRSNSDTDDEDVTEEMVLLMQDGLRLFLNGNTRFPLPDATEDDGEAEVEDQGQKAFNYRTEPLGRFNPGQSEYTLDNAAPATPVWIVNDGADVRFHLVGALDKPRSQSFTIHGVSWPEHRFVPQSGIRPIVSSESAITSGTVRTLEFTAAHPGDHAYRSGVLKWSVPQGMWGILRVQ